MQDNRSAKRFKPTVNGGGSGYGSVQIKSLENPFDTSNGQPKYPDGKATHSIGRRHQHTCEITLEDYMIVLFPGSVNWCLVLKPHSTDSVQIWSNHSTNISFNYSFSKKGNTAGNANNDSFDKQWEVGLDGFVQWRPVAYAMHMQLINSSDRNEGWYEAVRIDKNSLIRRWGVFGGIGSPLGNGNYIRGTPHFHNGGMCPSFSLCSDMYKSTTWNQEPTYISGELQDIHNAIFQLNCTKEDNDFRKISNVYSPAPGMVNQAIRQRDDLVDIDQMQLWIPFSNIDEQGNLVNPKDWEQLPDNFLTEQLCSDSFDIIVVRIHGTPGTKLLVHSVANIELLSAENGQMAQYATECDNNKQELLRFNEQRNSRFKYPFHYLAAGGYLRVPRPPYY